MHKMKITDVNHLNRDEFVIFFGNIVECFPKVASELFAKIPFQDAENFVQNAQHVIDGLSFADKEKILKLHPDLAGILADEGKLTTESTEEQKAAGLNQISPENKIKMNLYNHEYKQKFGFPFVICARENKVETILSGLQTRRNNIKEDELIIGINEVKKICKLRILNLIDFIA